MAANKFRKKKVGSYPFLSVAFSLSLALLVLGLFGLLLIHATALSEMVKQNLELQVHLKKSTTDGQAAEFKEELEDKPFLASELQNPIVFVSKEEAAKKFIQETGENFNEILSINPLRDVYRIKVKPEFADGAHLKEIKEELEQYPEVYEADYDAGLVSLINKNLSKVSLVLIGFSLILLITVVVLINNTVRLAMFSQRFLIRSMHLVGATDWFIIKPFLERAAIIGFFSGIVADVLIFLVLNYANHRIEGLAQLQRPAYLVTLFLALLVVSMAMSVLSTRVSVGRFLKMKLDELY